MMIRRVLVLMLALVAPLAAQQKKVTLRTLCFSHVNGVKKLYLPGPEPGSVAEVPLFTEVFSLPVEVTLSTDKVSFFLSAEPPAPGKARAALPPVSVPDSSKLLFLFLPNPGKPEAPYLVVPMADDESAFPLGTTKAMNLTPANIRFDLGEFAGAKGVVVAPGKTAIIESVKKVNHLNQFDAKVMYEVKPKEFAEFYNSRWRSVAGKRDIAIAYMDPISKKPMVNLYEDAPPAVIKPPGQ
jgi:hypothetical protein